MIGCLLSEHCLPGASATNIAVYTKYYIVSTICNPSCMHQRKLRNLKVVLVSLIVVVGKEDQMKVVAEKKEEWK